MAKRIYKCCVCDEVKVGWGGPRARPGSIRRRTACSGIPAPSSGKFHIFVHAFSWHVLERGPFILVVLIFGLIILLVLIRACSGIPANPHGSLYILVYLYSWY